MRGLFPYPFCANRYGTCILPSIKALPAILKLLGTSVSDGVLKLDPVQAFQAYTPYVLYAANGLGPGVLEGTVDASLYPEDYAFGHGERADGDCHAAGGHRGIHPAKPRGRREVLPCGGRAFCLACRTVLPTAPICWGEPQDGA